jgi:hypothetical protein
VLAVPVAVAVCRQGVERIAIGDLDTGVYVVNASNGEVLTREVTSVASSPDGALWQCCRDGEGVGCVGRSRSAGADAEGSNREGHERGMVAGKQPFCVSGEFHAVLAKRKTGVKTCL